MADAPVMASALGLRPLPRPSSPMRPLVPNSARGAGDDPRTDDALLHAHLRGGDAGAFAALMRRHDAAVRGTAIKALWRCGLRAVEDGTATEEDVVQETWWRVHRHAHTFRPGKSFRAWVTVIAANVASNTMRARRRRFTPAAGLDVSEARWATAVPAPGPATPSVPVEAALAAVRDLPQDFADVLWLRAVEGLPYDTIAALLSIPVGTVRSRLARAREAMRQWRDAEGRE